MLRNKEIQKLKIALTTDCVLNCRHCRIDKKAGMTVSAADARRAVDMLMESDGTEKRLEIYGGEPLLKFGLLKKTVDYAASASVRCGKKLSLSVATNGLLADAEKLEFLKSRRVNLSVSVSGSGASHDACRVYPDGRGSFSTLKEKIRLILSVMSPLDVVALQCAAPSGAASLSEDLAALAGMAGGRARHT